MHTDSSFHLRFPSRNTYSALRTEARVRLDGGDDATSSSPRASDATREPQGQLLQDYQNRPPSHAALVPTSKPREPPTHSPHPSPAAARRPIDRPRRPPRLADGASLQLDSPPPKHAPTRRRGSSSSTRNKA